MIFLDLLVLFILAVAVGAGVGGGGLLVAYLTLYRGFDQLPAQAVNLAFFIVAALSSALFQAKNRTLPHPRLIAVTALSALPGVFLGSRIRDGISSDSLGMFFGLFLIFTAFLVLRREFPSSGLLLGRTKARSSAPSSQPRPPTE